MPSSPDLASISRVLSTPDSLSIMRMAATLSFAFENQSGAPAKSAAPTQELAPRITIGEKRAASTAACASALVDTCGTRTPSAPASSRAPIIPGHFLDGNAGAFLSGINTRNSSRGNEFRICGGTAVASCCSTEVSEDPTHGDDKSVAIEALDIEQAKIDEPPTMSKNPAQSSPSLPSVGF